MASAALHRPAGWEPPRLVSAAALQIERQHVWDTSSSLDYSDFHRGHIGDQPSIDMASLPVVVSILPATDQMQPQAASKELFEQACENPFSSDEVSQQTNAFACSEPDSRLRPMPQQQTCLRMGRAEEPPDHLQLPRLNAIRWSEVPDNLLAHADDSHGSLAACSSTTSDAGSSVSLLASESSMKGGSLESASSTSSSTSKKSKALKRFSQSALAATTAASKMVAKQGLNVSKHGLAAVRSVTTGDAKSKQPTIYARPEDLRAARAAAKAAHPPAAAAAAAASAGGQQPQLKGQRPTEAPAGSAQKPARQQRPVTALTGAQLQPAKPVVPGTKPPLVQRPIHAPVQRMHGSAPGAAHLQSAAVSTPGAHALVQPLQLQAQPGARLLGQPGAPMSAAQQPPLKEAARQAQPQHPRPGHIARGQQAVQPTASPCIRNMQHAGAQQLYNPGIHGFPVMGQQQRGAHSMLAAQHQQQWQHGLGGVSHPPSIMRQSPAFVQHAALQQPAGPGQQLQQQLPGAAAGPHALSLMQPSQAVMGSQQQMQPLSGMVPPSYPHILPGTL